MKTKWVAAGVILTICSILAGGCGKAPKPVDAQNKAQPSIWQYQNAKQQPEKAALAELDRKQWQATAAAALDINAVPILVDVTEDTWCIDPAAVEAAITRRTKAIIPVHLYGQPADMDPILEIAREYGLAVIEDACEALGGSYRGRPAGSFGLAAAFALALALNHPAYVCGITALIVSMAALGRCFANLWRLRIMFLVFFVFSSALWPLMLRGQSEIFHFSGLIISREPQVVWNIATGDGLHQAALS
jgi:hypothetical protein